VFRPELLNRLDDIVIFHPLEPEQLRKLVDIFVGHTRERLALQWIDLCVTDSARTLLLQQGYQKQYGARPLRHVIQHLLEDRIAEAMLKGIIARGTTVIVSAEDEALTLTVEASSSGFASTDNNGDGHVAA
jgi:ATP-dependent Clp protease ATP-binding subunit ClpA